MDMKDFQFVIHGGAGVIEKRLNSTSYVLALKEIIRECNKFAKYNKNTALDIVEYAVILLENEPIFNAGKGAVFTQLESHELEASIMDGATLKCGAVSMVTNFKNPISLARIVMEKTNHSYMVSNESIEKIAVGLERVENSYYSTDLRLSQLHQAKSSSKVILDHNILLEAVSPAHSDSDHPGGLGTVGCVCMKNGTIAAATSTGGMTNKLSGRIGDSPVIGAGTYADNQSAAISATGKGEEFLRHVASYDVCSRIKYGNQNLKNALYETVQNVLPHNSGGMIAVNCDGDYSMEFNCPGMFRATCDSNGECYYGIWEDLIRFNVDTGDEGQETEHLAK